MNIRSHIIIAALLLSAASLQAQDLSRDSAFVIIDGAYNGGQYLSAELEARRLLEQPGLSTPQRVWLEGRIAFALIAQGKSPAAKERFIAVLRMDETYELDPVLTSPKILAVFNDARALFTARRRTEMQDSLRLRVRQQEEEDRTVTFRTVIFPGWEQLHHGRQTTGTLLMGAGITALASGITCEVLRSAARQDYLAATEVSAIKDAYGRYDTYRKGEIYSFGAFAAVYLLSEAEIFLGREVWFAPTITPDGSTGMRFSVKF